MSLLRKNAAAAIATIAVLAIVLTLRRKIADKLVCGIRVFNLKGQTMGEFLIFHLGFLIFDLG